MTLSLPLKLPWDLSADTGEVLGEQCDSNWRALIRVAIVMRDGPGCTASKLGERVLVKNLGVAPLTNRLVPLDAWQILASQKGLEIVQLGPDLR